MKKILFWEYHPHVVSGGAKMTLLVLDMLRDKFETVCITSEGEIMDEFEKRKVRVYAEKNKKLTAGKKKIRDYFIYIIFSLKEIFRGIRIIKNEQPDYIYVAGPMAIPWATICGSLTKCRVIWHLHHIYLDKMTLYLLNRIAAFKSVWKILAVSKVVGKQINNVKAISKIAVLYNPVDRMKYSSGNSLNVKEELGLNRTDKNSIIIGHIGNVQKNKKQDYVIKVVYEMLKKGYNVYALLAGGIDDYKYLEDLQKLISGYGIEEHIRLLGYREDIPDLLACMDVVVVSSFEGLPLAGLEALAAGVPIACADSGGAKELVEISGGGTCFKYLDIKDGVDAILRIISNKGKYIMEANNFIKQCDLEKYNKELLKVMQYE